MPHKHNPVLSVLVRRAALTTPQLAATLHLAAAEQVDERADGAWHAEWDTLRLLVRRTVVAASQTAELLDGLQVHADRMRAAAVTTLVLGPSIGTSADACWGAAATLLRDEFDVVAWELPGHGTDRGPVPDGLTIEDLAARVLAQVDGPFLYAGDSVGGPGRTAAAARRARPRDRRGALLHRGEDRRRRRVARAHRPGPRLRHRLAGERDPRSAGSRRASSNASRSGYRR